MRTTLQIAPSLINEAKHMAKVKTKTQAIVIALTEFIQKRKSQKILELAGSMTNHYDYKSLRKKR